MSADEPSLAELQALVRLRAVDEATAQLRHALRNKLAAIRNANFFIKRKLAAAAEAAGDPRIPQFFQIIDEESRSASDLIEGTKLEPPRPAAPTLDAARLVTRLVELLRPVAAGALSVSAPAPAPVGVERDDLLVAAHCLIENGLDAGATTVEVLAGERCVIRVRDDGPGFGAEARARAFEAGFTTKPGRRGLGLNVARRLAARWGGVLEVEAPERGAAVSLSFPRAAEVDRG